MNARQLCSRARLMCRCTYTASKKQAGNKQDKQSIVLFIYISIFNLQKKTKNLLQKHPQKTVVGHWFRWMVRGCAEGFSEYFFFFF